jgi:hypothetical protein
MPVYFKITNPGFVWTKESSINISVLQKEVLVPVLKELSTMP